jgi:hypothetical protein
MDEELISLRDRTNEITRRGGGGNDAGSGSGGSGGGGACAAPFENPPSNNKIGFRDEVSVSQLIFILKTYNRRGNI